MKTLRNLVVGIGMAFALSGCPNLPNPDKPVDDKRHWADITYIVEGRNGTPSASNITYGRIDGQDGDWVDGFYSTTGSVSLPWESETYTDCTGHWLRLGASTGTSPLQLRLKIKDDDKIVATKDITLLGNLEYYITTQK
ncbi:MAG: hypothetical protein PHQ66_02825 [Candidatus Nanoarchaeia archaeon]|nr:hypothetical protein [Candidatus Nanoarchaeia archaeon]MDD5357701.1 hypothetical protein [Candidatus Nanoarchaeia archaeon]MDD5588620.1 hypothetical protein [Candidatus Nanoarchaeia archaeon]